MTPDYSTMAVLCLTPHCTMIALIHSLESTITASFESTWLDITLRLLYFSLLDFILLYNALLHSTWLCISPPWLEFTVLGSTLLIHSSTLLHLTVYTVFYHSSTSLYLTLYYSTMHDFTLLSITLPWLYFTLLDSTAFYHGSTWLYITQSCLYCILHYSVLWLYNTLPWLHTSLYMTAFYLSSSSL